MEGQIRKDQGQIFSLNIDDLDVDELERRLEMAVASAESELEGCVSHKECSCPNLASCGTYCK